MPNEISLITKSFLPEMPQVYVELKTHRKQLDWCGVTTPVVGTEVNCDLGNCDIAIGFKGAHQSCNSLGKAVLADRCKDTIFLKTLKQKLLLVESTNRKIIKPVVP